MALGRLDIGTGGDQEPESWRFKSRYGPVFDGIFNSEADASRISAKVNDAPRRLNYAGTRTRFCECPEKSNTC